MTDRIMFVALETRKNQSIGTIIRCASAFGADAVIVVGHNDFSTHGSHGSQRRIRVLHFYYWTDCLAYLSANFPFMPFIGVSTREIVGSCPLDSVVLPSSICFVLPNERTGLFTDAQLAICSYMIHNRLPIDASEHLLPWLTKMSLAFKQFCNQNRATATIYGGSKFRVEKPGSNLSRKVVSIDYEASTEDMEAHFSMDLLGFKADY